MNVLDLKSEIPKRNDKKKANIIYSIVNTAFSLLIACIVILLVFTMVPGFGGYKFLVVRSGSMEPAIKTGSVIMVRPAENYKVGDIITFRQDEKISVTHRIFAEKKNKEGEAVYTTKGDANSKDDGNSVKRSDIIGKLQFRAPFAGYAVETAKKPWGFALIIVLPSAMIIMNEAANIRNEIRRIRKKNNP